MKGHSGADAEDWAWAAWGTQHFDELRADPDLRRAFADVHQLRSLTRADHDRDG